MRPPGNEICPAWAERCAVRWVSSTAMPPGWSISGTSTAAGRNAVLGGVMPGFKSWSPRRTRRNAAASSGSALPPKPRRPGCRSASRSMSPARVMGSGFLVKLAEPKEPAVAPYPELHFAGDLLLLAPLDQVVEYRARKSCLKPGAHQDIGRRHAIRSGLDAQLV